MSMNGNTMFLNKKLWTILTLVLVGISSCVYAASPRSLQSQNSLMFNLKENSHWIICEITQTGPLEESAKQAGIIEKVICKDNSREISFMTGHKTEIGEKYLIFSANSDFVLLADYSFPSDNMKAPDKIIKASKLGSISGGLRVVDVKIGPSLAAYVMVPKKWVSPVENYVGVGALKSDYSIILPCGVEDCNSNNVGYYLVPVVELF